jgi:hypothetical protein
MPSQLMQNMRPIQTILTRHIEGIGNGNYSTNDSYEFWDSKSGTSMTGMKAATPRELEWFWRVQTSRAEAGDLCPILTGAGRCWHLVGTIEHHRPTRFPRNSSGRRAALVFGNQAHDSHAR